MTRPGRPRWNHSLHYLPLVLDAVRPGCSAVDVGCGEGHVCRELVAAGAGAVTGIDLSAEMVATARRSASDQDRAQAGVEYVVGDLRAMPTGTKYDVVSCVATLHHVDLRAGLERLRDLTAPGGRLVVIGLARAGDARDVALGVASVAAHRVAVARRGYWEHPAPLADATSTTSEIRAAAAQILPGSRMRSRLYWRYTLEWTAPV